MRTHEVVRWGVALLLIVAGAFSYGLVRHFDQVNSRQDAADQSQRAALYRVCDRTNQTRAELYLDADGEPEEHPGGSTELWRRLPLYDCAPNLRGRVPQKLTLAQARRYVARYSEAVPPRPARSSS